MKFGKPSSAFSAASLHTLLLVIHPAAGISPQPAAAWATLNQCEAATSMSTHDITGHVASIKAWAFPPG